MADITYEDKIEGGTFTHGDANEIKSAVNSKQDALVSATNIKTINSTSLLGSGNIDTPDTTYSATDFDIKDLTDSTSLRSSWTGKQDTLVSGTSIKTINSTSLLGSGNIAIEGGSGAFDYTETTNPLTTTNPTAIGATWINTTTGEIFVCIDATAGGNVWVGTAGSSVGYLWTPSEITTTVWLDAADVNTIITDVGVSQWSDKSGNNNHATQVSSALQPSYDGHNRRLVFDGAEWLLLPDSLASLNSVSSFVVGQYLGTLSDPSSGYILFGRGVGDTRWYAGLTTSTELQWHSSILSAFANSSTRYRDLNILGQTHSGDTVTGYRNGVSVGSAARVSTGTITEWRVGSLLDGVEKASLIGHVQEIILLGRGASLDERQNIEGYLAHKWGLDDLLESSHPYKTRPPLR